MKHLIQIGFLTLALAFVIHAEAHTGGHGNGRTWEIDGKAVEAEFVQLKGNKVWLMNPDHQTQSYDLTSLSSPDQEFVKERHEKILEINGVAEQSESSHIPAWAWGLGLFLLTIPIFNYFRGSRGLRVSYLVVGLISIGAIACNDDTGNPTIDDNNNKSIPINDITFMKSIFESFSGVSTSSDNTYFYIGSNGIPDHQMMVGITNWQQQVPIDHSYTGTNSWAIPLQPELSDNPLSTKTNLLKGAIAIAANGIPIFNPLNNRGEDANAIGELDQWGGHCGRADDYHYHIPPTHLQSVVGAGKPIAYAVDGFPVYGETTDELDAYLGKFNDDGSYQYHTIKQYPYFIAGMRGKVTLDPNTSAPENQVIPQATTKGVRPALTPLNGAAITGFTSSGTNAYTLSYTLNGETHKINYSWTKGGVYTYEFVKPDGSTTRETYNR